MKLDIWFYDIKSQNAKTMNLQPKDCCCSMVLIATSAHSHDLAKLLLPQSGYTEVRYQSNQPYSRLKIKQYLGFLSKSRTNNQT